MNNPEAHGLGFLTTYSMALETQFLVYVPLALKLHAFGLSRLQDATWCGETLWEHAKRPYRGREEPHDLFRRTLEEGFLYQLGLWLFDEYLRSEDWFELQDTEWIVEYMDDFCNLLLMGEVPESSRELSATRRLLARVERIYEPDGRVFERYSGRTRSLLKRRHEALVSAHHAEINMIARFYAANYADRVFHDRELCGYIAQLILEIGIDGTTEDEEPSQWCERLPIPEWAKRALSARERGKCAACGADLAQELEADPHIDHIVPLAKGGCNDLVNLQKLCARCNLAKRAGLLPVRSSIPPYMRRRLEQA